MGSTSSTHIPLVPYWSTIPFLRYSFFKIRPSKSKVKIMDEPKIQSHKVGQTSYWLTHPFYPCQSLLLFLWYGFCKIWPWKSKVKVIAQSHIVGPTSYRFTSLLFQVNWSSHSWNTAFFKFDLENSRSWEWEMFKATKSVPLPIDSHPFHSALLFLWYGFFNIWPWKSKVNVISPWSCTTKGLDNSTELWTV